MAAPLTGSMAAPQSIGRPVANPETGECGNGHGSTGARLQPMAQYIRCARMASAMRAKSPQPAPPCARSPSVPCLCCPGRILAPCGAAIGSVWVPKLHATQLDAPSVECLAETRAGGVQLRSHGTAQQSSTAEQQTEAGSPFPWRRVIHGLPIPLPQAFRSLPRPSGVVLQDAAVHHGVKLYRNGLYPSMP